MTVTEAINDQEITIDFNNKSVSIIDDYQSNYGIIYDFNANKQSIVFTKNGKNVCRQKQLIGMNSEIYDTELIDFIYTTINNYYK